MIAAVAALALASAPAPEIPAWFRQARFGMFIHWGPVSLKGVEIGWARGDQVPAEVYDALYKRFNPHQFDADAWMRLAKRAGMRYVVPTAKHHDGFLLWPSKHDPFDYDIADSPFKRDIMGEIAKAAKKEGITMCTYYSILDWKSPDYPLDRVGHAKPAPNMARHLATMEAQLSELMDRYGAKMVWFDGNWEAPYTRDDSLSLIRFLRGKYPKLILNNRIDSTKLLPDDPHGDYRTPEQVVGSYDTEHPWETCMTLGDQWAYKPNDHYKTPARVIEVLLQTVTGDGNLLLNVGPDSTGRITAEQQAILEKVGEWTSKYGESIYGTRGGPYRNGAWGGTTRKSKTIYVQVTNWGNGEIDLPPLPAKIVSKRVLQKGVEVETTSDASGLKLKLKSSLPTGPTTIQLDLDRNAWSLGTIERHLVQPTDLSLDLEAGDAAVHGGTAKLQGDNIGYWTDPKNTVLWSFEAQKGDVSVELEYACEPDSAGSTFAVEVAGQTLVGTVESTGDWYTYHRVNLGKVSLPAGKAELTVRPLSMPHGAVMNLRAVRLRGFTQFVLR
ncbi:hypothetical protein BH11ARM2_BH11ARM2_00710 [soil metagenome]